MFATAHATTSAFLVAVVARAKTSTCAPLVTSATATGTTVTTKSTAMTDRTRDQSVWQGRNFCALKSVQTAIH